MCRLRPRWTIRTNDRRPQNSKLIAALILCCFIATDVVTTHVGLVGLVGPVGPVGPLIVCGEHDYCLPTSRGWKLCDRDIEITILYMRQGTSTETKTHSCESETGEKWSTKGPITVKFKHISDGEIESITALDHIDVCVWSYMERTK